MFTAVRHRMAAYLLVSIHALELNVGARLYNRSIVHVIHVSLVLLSLREVDVLVAVEARGRIRAQVVEAVRRIQDCVCFFRTR